MSKKIPGKIKKAIEEARGEVEAKRQAEAQAEAQAKDERESREREREAYILTGVPEMFREYQHIYIPSDDSVDQYDGVIFYIPGLAPFQAIPYGKHRDGKARIVYRVPAAVESFDEGYYARWDWIAWESIQDVNELLVTIEALQAQYDEIEAELPRRNAEYEEGKASIAERQARRADEDREFLRIINEDPVAKRLLEAFVLVEDERNNAAFEEMEY